jgi:hypothetical protein
MPWPSSQHHYSIACHAIVQIPLHPHIGIKPPRSTPKHSQQCIRSANGTHTCHQFLHAHPRRLSLGNGSGSIVIQISFKECGWIIWCTAVQSANTVMVHVYIPAVPDAPYHSMVFVRWFVCSLRADGHICRYCHLKCSPFNILCNGGSADTAKHIACKMGSVLQELCTCPTQIAKGDQHKLRNMMAYSALITCWEHPCNVHRNQPRQF